MREVQLQMTGNHTVRDVLDAISKAQGFYFSYNSRIVPADSLLTNVRYQGRLFDFLIRTFGPAYEFKESLGYVIIRYAPGHMAVSIKVEKSGYGPMVIEGQVTDEVRKRGIVEASVYERNTLASTLTGPTGDFRLTVKRPEETVWITVSKENYRDTTLALLPPVQISKSKKGRLYRFAPGEWEDGLDGTALGRFFTSSRQRIQRINLGGFFAYNPYQISLTPGLSSQGFFNSQVVNQLSLNIVGGHTAGVNGVEVGGVFNINQQQARYFQAAGLFNLVGNGMQGVQVAGVSNIVLGHTQGLQVAGVNNRAGNVSGAQLSGVFNVAREVRGVQVSSVINIASKIKGVQIAALINIADSSDYPIGLVNLIRNGTKNIALEVDESSATKIVFRSGGRRLYGLVGGGYRFGAGSMPYVLEAGIGIHIWRTPRLGLDAELVSGISPDFKTTPDQQASFRLLPAFFLDEHWGMFVGPTYGIRPRHTFQPGINGGIRYRW